MLWKNSKIQEVSQHSESWTLETRDLRRKLKSRSSRSVSESPEQNPGVFSKIRRDRSESPRHRPEGRRDGGVFNRLGDVTMRGHHHEIRKHSPKAKIAGVDTGNQGRRRQSQALKKLNFLNHGYVKRQIPYTPNFVPTLGDEDGTEGPMIIEAETEGHFIHRMYVDGGSASDILYEHCFNRLHPEVKNQMVPATAPLIGFSGEIIWPMGQILLPARSKEDSSSPINSSWNAKIPSHGRNTHSLEQQDNPTRMYNGLRARSIAFRYHSEKKPSTRKNKAIQEEVEKLVDAIIMKEVHYQSWLENPVMMKKHDDSWRMCVDFKDLNKACPKDDYPLSKIDWKVESLCEYPFNYFLDAYKGYHQIKIAKEDEEKTTFITSQGVFCYSKMPFGLKNIRATYQRLVDKAFQMQIEVKAAFKEMKKLIAKLPTLTAPMEKEELIVYLAATWEAVSAVLITEREAKQMPVYFVSRALQVERSKDDSLDKPMEAKEELSDPWTLFTDRSFCIDGSGVGLILTNLKGAKFTYALRFRFDTTNNEAEYKALIAGLRIAEQMGVKNLQANVDSCLVANPVLVVVEEEGDTWMTPIYNHLKEETLSAKKEKARAVRRKAITSKLRLKRNSCGIMQHACRNKICSSKTYTDRILLANNACGCKKIDKGMSRFLDRARPFPEGPGKVKFLIVAMDYFMKWIEAKPVATITDERSKDWIEELPHVQWAHRTMIKSNNGDTPFSLTYITEAVIPAKIGMLTMRTAKVDMVQNDEALKSTLIFWKKEESKQLFAKQRARQKWKNIITPKFATKASNLGSGDLVCRSNEASHAKESEKLSPKWEGPYEVT
nr:reverse transcriptase domain-containing protein [Tanacetum cinerariifolium]